MGLMISKEAIKHDQKEEVNVIPKKKPTAIVKSDMKSKGKKMKCRFSEHNNFHEPQSRSMVPIGCYNSNKPGHLARNCRNINCLAAQANLIEEDLVAKISKVNVIAGSEDLWLSTSASRDVYHEHSLFRKYNEIKDKNIILGDHHTTKLGGWCWRGRTKIHI